jgi:C1A family cysteine protease
MPNVQYDSQSTVHGWHAMLAVGYSDESKCFIVRNSWGEKWVSLALVLGVFMDDC